MSRSRLTLISCALFAAIAGFSALRTTVSDTPAPRSVASASMKRVASAPARDEGRLPIEQVRPRPYDAVRETRAKTADEIRALFAASMITLSDEETGVLQKYSADGLSTAMRDAERELLEAKDADRGEAERRYWMVSNLTGKLTDDPAPVSDAEQQAWKAYAAAASALPTDRSASDQAAARAALKERMLAPQVAQLAVDVQVSGAVPPPAP